MSDAILQAIAGLQSDMKASAEDVAKGLKNRDEELAKIGERMAALEEDKRKARHEMPDHNPVKIQDTITGDAMAARAGWKSLPYQKALDLPIRHPMLRGSDKEELSLLHDYHDAVAIKMDILKRKGNDKATAWRILLNGDPDLKMYAALGERAGFFKANEIMNPAGITALDFTYLSSTLISLLTMDLVVGNQFDRVQLTRHKQDLPTKTNHAKGVWGTTVIPARSSGATTDSTAVNTAPLPSFATPNYFSALTFGTVSFATEHLLTFLVWNDDMLEDSIVPWLPMMREEAAYGSARALDEAVMNGDSGTGAADHMDKDHRTANSGTGAANDFCMALTGLRRYSQLNWKDLANGAYAATTVEALRKSMGTYGRNPAELVLFLPLGLWYDTMLFANVLTVDKFGPNATIHTGVQGKLYGIDIAVSEHCRIDTNGAGVYDGSTVTQKVITLANRRYFAVGVFGSTSIEQTRIAPWLTDVIQADVRLDFRPWDTTALNGSDQWAASTVNIPCNCTVDIA